MIKVKATGGLGNQLFQIAYGLHIAKVTGHDLSVDTSAYNSYKIRNFSLENFYIADEIYIFESKDKKLKIYNALYRISQKIFKNYLGIKDHGKLFFPTLSKKGFFFNFDPYFYSVEFSGLSEINIYGYFQSELYFKGSEDLVKSKLRVKKLMTAKEEEYLKIIKSSTTIAVSLRLGKDYTYSKNLNICDSDFYNDAIRIMLKIKPEAKLVIFSDDIYKAKNMLEGYSDIIFIEGCNDYESLRLMYNCDNFIIANSSFSWWGAYLGCNPDKIIITPDQWYRDIKSPSIYSFKHVKISEFKYE